MTICGAADYPQSQRQRLRRLQNDGAVLGWLGRFLTLPPGPLSDPGAVSAAGVVPAFDEGEDLRCVPRRGLPDLVFLRILDKGLPGGYLVSLAS